MFDIDSESPFIVIERLEIRLSFVWALRGVQVCIFLRPLDKVGIGWIRASKLEDLDVLVGILESRNMV
jgi:hypothetical protein